MSQTQFTIHNNTTSEVKIHLTLGAAPSCIQNIKNVPFITYGSGLQGWFNLPASTFQSYTPPS